MQSNFRLVMRSGPSVGKVYPLDKPELFLGRDLSNDIVINDPEISRRHSRLFSQGNSYILEDLGSTNGTFVNGQRLMGPNVLRPGDVITFGERMSLIFEAADFDPDATVVGPTARPAYEEPAAPAYSPPPTAYASPQPNAYPAPDVSAGAPPADGYANQMPAAYAPEAYTPAGARKAPSRTVWIIAAGVLLLSCLCVAVLLWNAPKELWCLLPIWPVGACP